MKSLCTIEGFKEFVDFFFVVWKKKKKNPVERMKKRPYRNREIWDFESEIMELSIVDSDNGGGGCKERREEQVILGLDGGTTNTVCVCIAFDNNSIGNYGPLPDPPPVIARAVAGCSNHNSVGGTFSLQFSEFCCFS